MPSLREAAETLSRNQGRLEEIGEEFDGLEGIETDATVKEGFLSKDIKEKQPDTVAGVDGGIIKKRFSSGDVVAVRAVAALFSYGGELDVGYIPERNPEPEFHVYTSRDSDSFEKRAEAERLREESSAALKALEEAEKVLMDGSIVPSYSGEGEVLERYQELFDEAGSGRLVGVIEDSHGLKQSSILEERLGLDIGPVRDTLLMEQFLEPGERSFVRRFSTSPVEHPVLQDLEESQVNRIHTFYLKLSSRDLPLRIDFFGEPDEADRIAGELMSLKSSESYTVPSPIVEADKRASIQEKYLKRLEKRFSPELRRRNRRRF